MNGSLVKDTDWNKTKEFLTFVGISFEETACSLKIHSSEKILCGLEIFFTGVQNSDLSFIKVNTSDQYIDPSLEVKVEGDFSDPLGPGIMSMHFKQTLEEF